MKTLITVFIFLKETLPSMGTGVIVGLIFGYLGLPIPAPNVLNGILGIVGIFIGYKIICLVK